MKRLLTLHNSHQRMFLKNLALYNMINKVCGPDNLPAQMLKVFISFPLSCLFQLSLSSGTLPRDWVAATLCLFTKRLINTFHQTITQSVLLQLL